MDAVMHLVSTTLPKGSNDDPIYDVQSNVVATLQMLNAMVAHQVRKIVFISSGGTVYGNPKYLPVDESRPTDPFVSYGITKIAIEKYLYLYQYLHGIKTVTLRVEDRKSNRTAAEVGGTIAPQEGSPQRHSASRRGEMGSRPPSGKVPGGLAASLRGRGRSGCRGWRVACVTRRREAATTAPAGRRRTPVAVGPGRPSRVRPRRAGRPTRVTRVLG